MKHSAHLLNTLAMAALLLATGAQAQTSTPEGLKDPGLVLSSPDKAVAQEKLLLFMHHRDDWSSEHYKLHYLENHAPAGLKYTRNLIGYTVDFAEKPGDFDSITENWVHSAMDVLDPTMSFATPEAMKHVTSDQMSDGKSRMYAVKEKLVRGETLSSPLGQPTPGVKVVWIYRPGEKVPPPPAGGYRVVDNMVDHQMEATMVGDGVSWKKIPSDVSLVRMVWARDLAELGTLAPGAIVMSEYRLRASPWK